ncbi:hypothetical protein [Aureibacter tunicatorum]|uniref:Uncharacterized protein n=1 Tax=Aureibacter tunicatorum TaxID=866807 RepID=A0AAE3XSU2_9BACT|nr:hypothetical protein [Aureibacter tunicatorum]MDR6241463.1 hypothetical protein [Aureibacter tunicatorum]
MREFGKTPRQSIFKKILNIIGFFTGGGSGGKYEGFRGHNDRMENRRRKTLFDR